MYNSARTEETEDGAAEEWLNMKGSAKCETERE